MSDSVPQTTTYTPLETLLLFHNLSTHGTHPSSFSLISHILLRNPLVKTGDTFDKGRLSPDALREFYHFQLQEAESELGISDGNTDDGGGRTGSLVTRRKKEAKTPPIVSPDADKLPLVKTLTSRLYERYRAIMFRQIRDDEVRCSQLDQEMKEISSGSWDDRLLKEHNGKTGRSTSKTPLGHRDRKSTSPMVRRSSVGVVPPESPSTIIVSPEKSTSGSPTTPSSAPLAAPSPVAILPTAPKVMPVLEKSVSPTKPVQPVTFIPTSMTSSQQNPMPYFNGQSPRTHYEPIMPAPGNSSTDVQGNQAVFMTSKPPMSTSPRAPKILPAIPLAVPPKMEAVPPPSHLNTSLPVAPPPTRPQGTKIDAPVPPPTRAPYPPITPRTPGQMLYPPSHISPARTPVGQSPGQPIQTPSQGLGGLPQLADMADMRWQQQRIPSPHSQHPPPQLPHLSSLRQVPIAALHPSPQTYRPPTNTTPGGSYGILYPTQSAGSPVLQYAQPRPIAAAPPTTFQYYNPHTTPIAPAQVHRPTPMPQSSPTSAQKIASRPLPTPSAAPVSYFTSRRAPPPPPINTGVSIPLQPAPAMQPVTGREEHPTLPGSPIRPGPDEISPISTPSRSPSPPMELPKPVVTEKPRGRKRLLPDTREELDVIVVSERIAGNKEEAPVDKPRPMPKRQKSSKQDKKPPPSLPPPPPPPPPLPTSRVTRSASLELLPPLPPPPQIGENDRLVSPISEASELKDEELSRVEIEAKEETLVSPKSPMEKAKPGRATRKTSATRKADADPVASPEVVPETPRGKSAKRKRAESQTPPSAPADREKEIPTPLPRKPLSHRPPKLEPQNSGATVGAGSPGMLGVAVGQQQMVVATKKFLQLSAPLLGNISSHKFANLFTNPVNERMAPGYRNLVFKPEDLKSIKAAVKAGAAAISNASTGTPAITTPTTETIATFTPPANSSTFTTLPATTLNTPPKGIVNSVQLEKELFRMFANAIMYNRSTTEIAKETVIMARDVEGMVDNFRTAEEAGMKKALGARFGLARKERAVADDDRADRESTIAGEDADELGEDRRRSTGITGNNKFQVKRKRKRQI